MLLARQQWAVIRSSRTSDSWQSRDWTPRPVIRSWAPAGLPALLGVFIVMLESLSPVCLSVFSRMAQKIQQDAHSVSSRTSNDACTLRLDYLYDFFSNATVITRTSYKVFMQSSETTSLVSSDMWDISHRVRESWRSSSYSEHAFYAVPSQDRHRHIWLWQVIGYCHLSASANDRL